MFQELEKYRELKRIDYQTGDILDNDKYDTLENMSYFDDEPFLMKREEKAQNLRLKN